MSMNFDNLKNRNFAADFLHKIAVLESYNHIFDQMKF